MNVAYTNEVKVENSKELVTVSLISFRGRQFDFEGEGTSKILEINISSLVWLKISYLIFNLLNIK